MKVKDEEDEGPIKDTVLDTLRYNLFSHRIALVGATNLVISLSSLIILPIVTRNLSVEYYGILVQAIVTVGLIPLISGLGLPGAMVRFMAAEKDRKRIQEGFYSVFIVLVGTGALTMTIMLALADSIASVLFGGRGDIVRIVAVIVLFECINSSMFNYFRTFQQIKSYAGAMIAQTLLFMGLLVGALLMGYGLVGASYAILVSRVIMLVLMVGVIAHEIGARRPDFSVLREYLDYSVPYIPYDLSDWLLSSSDRYLIAGLLGLAFVGYYNPAYSIAMIVLIMVSPLRFLLPPTLSKLYDEGRLEEVKKYLSYSMKYFLLLAIPAAVGLGILALPWLEVLTTPEIASNGYLVTPIVAIGMIFYGGNVMAHQVLILKKKTKLIGGIMITAAIVNIVLNIIILPIFGILGAAYATVVAYVLAFGIMSAFAQRDIEFRIDGMSVLKAAIAAALMGVFIYLLDPHGLLFLIVAVVIGIAIYIGAVYGMKVFTPKEIQFFKNVLRRDD
jgi:O-antigen/teichoic acid export membrane protein